MLTLAVAETDKQVLKDLERDLEGKFKLQTFSGHFERDDEKFRFVDLIIYDLKGGNRSGLAELKMLREARPSIPILVLAPPKSSTILEKALALEATDFLGKPFNKVELQFRVHSCLRHFGYRKMASGSAEIATKIVSSRKSQPAENRVSIEVPLSNLHGPTGQLDAAAVAKYLSIPLAKLAVALGINYTTLHKTPDSVSAQPALATIKRILVILSDMLGKRETVLAWLKSPHPNLGDRTPISVILEGHGSAVAAILENALAGVPS